MDSDSSEEDDRITRPLQIDEEYSATHSDNPSPTWNGVQADESRRQSREPGDLDELDDVEESMEDHDQEDASSHSSNDGSVQAEVEPADGDTASESESGEDFGENSAEGESEMEEGPLDGDRQLSSAEVKQLVDGTKVSASPRPVVNADNQATGDSSSKEKNSAKKQNSKKQNSGKKQNSPKTDILETHFSPKTIRRVMSYITTSHDVRISHPAVKAVAVSLRSFVQSFIQEAFRHSQRNGRKMICYSDISHVANHFTTLFFLAEFLPVGQSAGFVVKKILDAAGVDAEKTFLVNEGDVLQDEMEERKKTSDLDAKSITASAMSLATKWDEEKNDENWRLTAPKTKSRKSQKRNKKPPSF